MSKKSILGIVGVFAFVVMSLNWLLRLKGQQEENVDLMPIGFDASKTYLFIGEGCGHCVAIEKFIKEGKIEEKVAIEIQEVFVNIENQKNYKAAFGECKKKIEGISVPVLYHKGACFQGEDEIKGKLEELAGIKK
jgi:glutaredoxin